MLRGLNSNRDGNKFTVYLSSSLDVSEEDYRKLEFRLHAMKEAKQSCCVWRH